MEEVKKPKEEIKTEIATVVKKVEESFKPKKVEEAPIKAKKPEEAPAKEAAAVKAEKSAVAERVLTKYQIDKF